MGKGVIEVVGGAEEEKVRESGDLKVLRGLTDLVNEGSVQDMHRGIHAHMTKRH